MERILSQATKFDRAILQTRDKLKEFVESRGGYFSLHDNCTSGITTQDSGHVWDYFKDVYILALKVEDDQLWFFAEEVLGPIPFTTDDDYIKQNTKDWYCLDYDCGNAFEFNLARIIFHLECFAEEYRQ